MVATSDEENKRNRLTQLHGITATGVYMRCLGRVRELGPVMPHGSGPNGFAIILFALHFTARQKRGGDDNLSELVMVRTLFRQGPSLSAVSLFPTEALLLWSFENQHFFGM